MAEGVHQTPPPGVDLQVLASKHAADNPDTVSAFLLRHIGLENRRVRVNKKNDTNSLSFRNLAHLCLVGEGDFQKQSSPIEGGHPLNSSKAKGAAHAWPNNHLGGFKGKMIRIHQVP